MHEQAPKGLIWVLMILLTLIWGSSFLLLKYALEMLHPAQVAALRISMAGLVLLPAGLVHIRHVARHNWVWLVLFTVLANIGVTLLNAVAQTGLDSAVAGTLYSLIPMMTLGTGVLFFRQRGRLGQLLGLLLGLGGTALLIWVNRRSPTEAATRFIAIALVAAFFNGLMANLLKYKLSNLTAFQVASVSFLLVLPLMLAYVLYSGAVPLVLGSPAGLQAGLIVAVLGIFANALALILFRTIIDLSSPVFASLTTYFIPVVAIFWGVLDGEPLGWHHMLALLLLLAGVWVVRRASRQDT
ncbi:MAG: DMT family transporter [Bacteroidia bacterium]